MTNQFGIQAILDTIEEKGVIIESVNDINPAIDHFATNEALSTVIATDGMLLGSGQAMVTLRSEVRRYVHKGGKLILVWPYDIAGADSDHFFRIFELPWKAAGEYYRANHSINSAGSFRYFDVASKLADYEMQAGLLNNVLNRDCLYSRDTGNAARSMHVDRSELKKNAVAVAFTKIGDGNVGFVGDEEERETVDVILAMLGLL